MRGSKSLLFIAFLLLISSPLILAQDATQDITQDVTKEVDIFYFRGEGCHFCAKMTPFLEELSKQYPINVQDFEIYFSQENRDLFDQTAAAYNTEVNGVPGIFINDKVIVGHSTEIEQLIIHEVEQCILLGDDCTSPQEKIAENDGGTGLRKKLTLGAVLSAAIVDAINPCAFAVLIILLSTVLASGNRRRMLLSGLAFTTAIFISYFLMGLGLYSAINAAGITRIIFTIAATLAIILGLFNLKDYLWYGKWFVMEVPMSWRPAMRNLIMSVTSIPGAFLIGFLVSLFLLPCTSGPYIVILSLLAETVTRNSAILWLLLYNFIFILPMLIITAIIYFGLTTTEQLNELRLKKLKTLHLIAGVVLLLLGIGMFIAMALGII